MATEADGVPSRIEWRVLDENTGAELIRRLDHPHQGEGTVWLLVTGYPSQSTIGSCRIPLHDPGTRQWSDALADYLKLRKGLRLEGYEGLDTSGTPRYSYVITDVERTTDSWSISCDSSVTSLAKSRMLPGEILASPISGVLPSDGLQIVRYLTTSFERQWSDDFSGYGGGTGPHPSTDYTQAGWSFTAADPYESAPALTSTNTAIDAYFVSNTTWANLGPYWAGVVTVTGTLKPGTAASPNNSGDISIILLGDAAWNNGLLVRAGVIYNGTTWDVQVDVNSKAAGAYTGRGGPVTNVLTALRSPFPFQLQVPIFMNAGRHTIGCWLNGKDSGLYVQDTGFFAATGGVGMRFVPTAGGAPQIWVNQISFKARPVRSIWGTPRFANGSQWVSSPTGAAIPQEIPTSRQSHLDMILMMAATDGAMVRITPGRGYKADAFDYASSLNALNTNQVVLRQPGNVVSAQLASVDASFADDIRMNAIPGSDTGGTVTRERLGATNDQALENEVADLGQPSFRFLGKWASLVQNRQADPLRSIVLEVVRTPELASAFREGDLVSVDVSRINVNTSSALVVGYGWSEVKGTFPVILNDFPTAASSTNLRVTNPVGWVTRIVTPR